MIPGLNPGFVLLLGALLVPLLRGRARQVYLLLLPLLSAAQLLGLEQGSGGAVEWAGVQLVTLRVDALSLVFGYVFHLALFVGLIFALHVEDALEHTAAILYGGATIVCVFAGDMVTLFVGWEVVAVASAFLIWARRTRRAYLAGLRYMAWQVLSGLLLLAGVLVLSREAGAGGGLIAFDAFDPTAPRGWAWYLLFFGFGIKSAFPVLHVWLTDAYPEATPTGAVFLSAFTSKLAVYALARTFAGTEELIYIGAAMAAFPIFYAVIENDLRRVLAYSLINQVGFMVVGVGLGPGLGIDGAVAHAFADIIFKGLLFMTMGAVLFRTGKINGNELGDLYKTMPFTAACCLVGAASISAFPLFSAFATKSLVMQAVAEEHQTVVWFLLLFAAAGVFHHAGIKIPYFAFFSRPHGEPLRPPEAPWNMRVAMGLSAALCIAIGCYPWALYELLPYPEALEGWHVYTGSHVVTQLQLLFFSALAFCTLMLTGRYPPELHSLNLDFDWLWRRPARVGWGLMTGRLTRAGDWVHQLLLERLPAACARGLMRVGPQGGELARRLAVGGSVIVMVGMLAVYLVVSGS